MACGIYVNASCGIICVILSCLMLPIGKTFHLMRVFKLCKGSLEQSYRIIHLCDDKRNLFLFPNVSNPFGSKQKNMQVL